MSELAATPVVAAVIVWLAIRLLKTRVTWPPEIFPPLAAAVASLLVIARFALYRYALEGDGGGWSWSTAAAHTLAAASLAVYGQNLVKPWLKRLLARYIGSAFADRAIDWLFARSKAKAKEKKA